MFEELIEKIKKIWYPKRIQDYPEVSGRDGFTGLEVLTRINGEIVVRVLHPADVLELSEHWYLIPMRLDDKEQLTGYTIKMHKNLY